MSHARITGKVLAIGGVKEKTIAAQRANIRHLVLPEENRRDFEELPAHIRRGLRVYFAADYSAVFDAAFGTAQGEPGIAHKHATKKSKKHDSDKLEDVEGEEEIQSPAVTRTPAASKTKSKSKRSPAKKKVVIRGATAENNGPLKAPPTLAAIADSAAKKAALKKGKRAAAKKMNQGRARVPSGAEIEKQGPEKK